MTCRQHFLFALSATLLALPASPQSDTLGRLFFTPEARAALDRRRELGGAADGPATLTLNGLVRRSSGRNTTWINGEALSERDALPGGWQRLRVGETLHLDNGEREDLLLGGRIVVLRPSASARP